MVGYKFYHTVYKNWCYKILVFLKRLPTSNFTVNKFSQQRYIVCLVEF